MPGGRGIVPGEPGRGLGPYRRLDFNSILPAELKMLFGYSTGFHTVSNVQTESQAALIWVRRSPGM